MTAKTYLRKIAWDEIKIEQKKFHLKSLGGNYNYMQAIDYSRDKVQTSARDALGEMVVREMSKVERLRAEIMQDIARFEEDRNEIINQIQGMKQAKHAALLFKRYVEHKEFLPISIEMGYTYEYVINMHGVALREFEKQYMTKENPDA